MHATLQTHGYLYQIQSSVKSIDLNTAYPNEEGIAKFLSYSNNLIRKLRRPITLRQGKHRFDDIVGFNRVSSIRRLNIDERYKPHGDIAAIALDDGEFKEVFWFNLDYATKASGIRYYSGISYYADGSKPFAISGHKEVQEFLEKVAEKYSEIVNSHKSFYSVIEEEELIGKALWGPEYEPHGKYKEDAVHGRGEGKSFSLSRLSGGKYQLKFSKGFRMNNDDLWIYKKEHNVRSVVISAEKSLSHHFSFQGKDYPGVRVVLKPLVSILSGAEKL